MNSTLPLPATIMPLSTTMPQATTHLAASYREGTKPSPATQRIEALDAARFLAALGVVWIHVPRSDALLPTSIFGRFAVPFFAAAAIYFVVTGVAKRPRLALFTFLVAKFQRLYVPFLAWSGLYIAFKFVKYCLLPSEPNDFPGVEFLWFGAAYHLWFIPFLILASVGAFGVAKFIVPWSDASSGRRQRVHLTMLVLGTVSALLSNPWSTNTDPLGVEESPLAYMWDALPAVCWGFALAFSAKSESQSAVDSVRRPLAALGIMLVVLCALYWVGRNALLENYAGLLLFIAALEMRGNWITRQAAKIGPYALGIYFSHLLIVKVLESFSAKLSWSNSWSLDVTCFAIVAVTATLGSMLLAKYSTTRWLVV